MPESPVPLICILGPTAAGKTRLAAHVAAIANGEEDLILGYLQAAVDYAAVKAVYQESDGEDVGALIKAKFTENDDVIEYLLTRTGLLATGLTVVEDEFGRAE